MQGHTDCHGELLQFISRFGTETFFLGMDWTDKQMRKDSVDLFLTYHVILTELLLCCLCSCKFFKTSADTGVAWVSQPTSLYGYFCFRNMNIFFTLVPKGFRLWPWSATSLVRVGSGTFVPGHSPSLSPLISRHLSSDDCLIKAKTTFFAFNKRGQSSQMFPVIQELCLNK